MLGGLILAGGDGSRFGPESKLIQDLDGRPLLEYAILAMSAVAAIDPIVVVLGRAGPGSRPLWPRQTGRMCGVVGRHV